MINTLSLITMLCHLWLQQPTHPKSKQLPETAKQWFDLQKRHKDYYDDCAFTKKYSVKQRLKKYPFVKASAIVAVSYHAEEPSEPTIFDNEGKQIDSHGKRIVLDASKTKPLEGLHIKKGKIDTKTLSEFVALNDQQINALTNIIYNTDFRVKIGLNSVSQGGCFEPRNALIFLDKKGKAFDYIEICFECKNAESHSQRLNIGTSCTQKYDILKKYFIGLGIKTGTLEK